MITLGRCTSEVPYTRLMDWDLEWIKTEKENLGFIFRTPLVFSKEDRTQNLKKYDVGF